MPIPALRAPSDLRLRGRTTDSNDNATIKSSQAHDQNESTRDVSKQAAKVTSHPTLARNVSFRSDAEGGKRQSFLPQPGLPRYATRSGTITGSRQRSNEENSAAQDAPERSDPSSSTPTMIGATRRSSTKARLRPRSMYQIDAVPPAWTDSNHDLSTSRLTRNSVSMSKSSEPHAAGLVRSLSLHKHGSSKPADSAEGSSSAQFHNQSAKMNTAIRKDTASSEVLSERPRSILIPSSNHAKTKATPTGTFHYGTRSSARPPDLSRPASMTMKAELPSTNTSHGMAVKPECSAPSLPKRQDPSREDAKKAARPAFSTLQQHFTPRKLGKAPTATFLHPQSAPGAETLPPEIVALQMQLLQLHLWHAASSQISRSWEISAKQSLQKRFNDGAQRYRSMLEYETAAHEQRNLQALIEWDADGASMGLVEHVKTLSELLHELTILVEPEGRLQRMVAVFEHWLSDVQEVRFARRNSHSSVGSLEAVGGLEDWWKTESAALLRRLTMYDHDLNKLSCPSAGSSLFCIIGTCKSLLEGTLDELRIMQAIEKDVAAKEKQWIEDHIRTIANTDAFPADRDVGVPLWQK